MQNNPRKQDIIQELRDKRQDVTELCTEAEAVNEPHTDIDNINTTESILTSVKKLLGIDESYTHFDADLIMHINSVFSILGQMGVGPKKGFAISGADEKWSDFLEDDPGRLALVKSYMHLKVRLLFDLPTASSAVDAMNRQISEFEWRLFVAADNAAREEESQNG